MRSFLGRILEHAVPLAIVCLLMAGSAVAGGLITGSQIKDGTITGKDVKDGSLSAKDFKGGLKALRGPIGPTGPAGAPGARGEPGAPSDTAAIETEEVAETVLSSTENPKEKVVKCLHGPVLGGGYVTNPNEAKAFAVRSYAVASNEWLVRAITTEAGSTWSLTVVAVCAK